MRVVPGTGKKLGADHSPAAIRYFAYGSNLHPARLGARLTAPRLLGIARLDAHVLRFHKRGRDGSGKCSIAPGRGCVHGALYALDVADKQALDRIEGVGAGYASIDVELAGNGVASTYVAMADAIDDSLEPFDWYLALVIAGARFQGFPADYLAALGAVSARPDPDPARAREHARLLAALARHSPS